jgi:hypothetical protein
VSLAAEVYPRLFGAAATGCRLAPRFPAVDAELDAGLDELLRRVDDAARLLSAGPAAGFGSRACAVRRGRSPGAGRAGAGPRVAIELAASLVLGACRAPGFGCVARSADARGGPTALRADVPAASAADPAADLAV